MATPKYHVFINGMLQQPNDIQSMAVAVERFDAAVEAHGDEPLATVNIRKFGQWKRKLRTFSGKSPIARKQRVAQYRSGRKNRAIAA